MILFLDRLPELQHLDPARRKKALEQWRRELTRSWAFYLQDVALRLSAVLLFAILRFSAFPSLSYRWFDLSWFVVGWLLGYIASARILYFKHRDILQTILQEATFAP